MQPALNCGTVRIRTHNEKSIAGTGFVFRRDPSPHILTCAHVVADALKKLGVNKQQSQVPQEKIPFDFLALDRGSQIFYAEVVLWWPANPDEPSGHEDVAILKVQGELPSDITPLPLHHNLAGINDCDCKAYGFPRGTSEQCRNGNMIQAELLNPTTKGLAEIRIKSGQVTDADQWDRLISGFSGAAIWDGNRVVGMATRADKERIDEKNIFAVTPDILWAACQEVDALCPQAIATQSLMQLLQPYCEQYPQAIARAWRYTFPDRLGKPPGLDESVDIERLVKDIQGDIPGADPRNFVGNLLISLTEPPWNFPADTLDSLNRWLDHQVAELSKLMEQLRDAVTLNHRHQQTCLAVLVREQAGQYRIGAVLVENLETYVKAKKDYFWLSSQDIQDWPVIDPTSDELSDALNTFMAARYAYTCKDINKIHFFLPIALIGQGFDQLKLQPESKTPSTSKIGKKYEVVVRFIERWEGTKGLLKIEDWRQKSENLRDQLNISCADLPPLLINLADEIEDIAEEMETHCVVTIPDIVDEDTAKWLFDAIQDGGLPVALWQRDAVEPADAWDQVWPNNCWRTIPQHIQQLRRDARRKTPNHFGHHVGLLWDDHTTVPPQPRRLGMTILKEQAK